MPDTQPPSPPSAAWLALKARCPACATGKLYKTFLTINAYCPHCGVNLAEREQGDGPAFLAVLIVGAFTAIGATVMDMKLEPPLWVDAAVWVPFVLIGSITALRWLKAWMIAVQYQYRKDDFNKH